MNEERGMSGENNGRNVVIFAAFVLRPILYQNVDVSRGVRRFAGGMI